jgi:hypothetical protein
MIESFLFVRVPLMQALKPLGLLIMMARGHGAPAMVMGYSYFGRFGQVDYS